MDDRDDPLCANGTFDDYCSAQEEFFGPMFTREVVDGVRVIGRGSSQASFPASSGSLIHTNCILLSASILRARVNVHIVEVNFNYICHPLSGMAEEEEDGTPPRSPRSAVGAALNLLLRSSANRLESLLVRCFLVSRPSCQHMDECVFLTSNNFQRRRVKTSTLMLSMKSWA